VIPFAGIKDAKAVSSKFTHRRCCVSVVMRPTDYLICPYVAHGASWVWDPWFRLNFVKNLCLNYYSRNLVLFNFRGDNARVFQRVSMNFNMTVGQAACQLLCRSIYSKPAGCVLRMLNRTDCYVWLCQKNLCLFMFEMHLISGITHGWQAGP